MTQIPPPPASEPVPTPQPTPEPQPTPAPEASPVPATDPQPATANAPKSSKTRRNALIAAGAVVLVGLVVAAAVFVVPLVTGDNDSTNTAETGESGENGEPAEDLPQVVGTPEEFAETQVEIDAVSAAFVAHQEAYGALITTASTEMNDSEDPVALMGYDRAAEVVAETEVVVAADATLAAALNTLYASNALQNDDGRAMLTDVRVKADAYLESSAHLQESAPVLANAVTGCLQPTSGIGDLITESQYALEDLLTQIDGGPAYDPATALARYDANPTVLRCNEAIAANPGPLTMPTMDGILTSLVMTITNARENVKQVAEAFVQDGQEAGLAMVAQRAAEAEAQFVAWAEQMTTEQDAYIASLDFDPPLAVLAEYVAGKV